MQHINIYCIDCCYSLGEKTRRGLVETQMLQKVFEVASGSEVKSTVSAPGQPWLHPELRRYRLQKIVSVTAVVLVLI